MKKQPHIQNPFNSIMSNTTHVVEHIKSGIKTTVNAFLKVDKLCLKYMFEFEF